MKLWDKLFGVYGSKFNEKKSKEYAYALRLFMQDDYRIKHSFLDNSRQLLKSNYLDIEIDKISSYLLDGNLCLILPKDNSTYVSGIVDALQTKLQDDLYSAHKLHEVKLKKDLEHTLNNLSSSELNIVVVSEKSYSYDDVKNQLRSSGNYHYSIIEPEKKIKETLPLSRLSPKVEWRSGRGKVIEMNWNNEGLNQA